jgi:cytoplasmic iron level regulating protein YaaA (DUF328/UPF0246 family)
MLIVVPPSETKVSGGRDGSALDLDALSFQAQNPLRRSLVDQLVMLAGNQEASLKALKLGPKGLPEVARNAELLSSPVMPAISRYTGVLYDAVGLASLEPVGRKHLDSSVAIFSALFGLIRASDYIPAYRLSWDSALPAGKPARQWAESGVDVWAEVPDFVLDLRSEGYRALAPVPAERGVFVNLVQPGRLGSRRALGHANKASKGALVRALVSDQVRLSSAAELVAWGQSAGWMFDPDSHHDGHIELVISGN